ncbi:MAG: hypothetical protein ACO1SX_19235 [Actinomycetota bacterium]
MPKPKGATSLKLSAEALALLAAVAKNLGVTKTAVLEIAIREKAKREGVTVSVSDESP